MHARTQINDLNNLFQDVSEEITLEEQILSEKEKQVEEEKDVISDEEVLHSKYITVWKRTRGWVG